MRVSEMVTTMMKSQSLQKQKNEPTLKNGSAPPAGHVNPFEDPHMNITGRSPSEWQKTIPVDDQVAQQLKKLVKEDFVKRNGMCGLGAQADAQANIVKKYIATLPGEQRLAASFSCGEIASKEASRLSAKIREQNPNWQYGQSFDTSILDNDFDIQA